MKIKEARETMSSAFAADPDFREAYVDNIAMLLHDRFEMADFVTRNQAADAILTLIFETKCPN